MSAPEVKLEIKLDAKLARLIHTAEAPGILYGGCLDPATGHYYAGGADGYVYRLATRGEQPLPEKGTAEKLWRHHDNYLAGLVWHDGVVISAGYDHKLVWKKAVSGEKLREVIAHEGWLRDVVLVGNERLATVADDMLVKIWSLSGELIQSCSGHEKLAPEGYLNSLYAVAASADGKQVAAADRTGIVTVWNAATGEKLARLEATTFYTFDAQKRARAIGGIRSLCFLPNGHLVLGGIGQVSNVDGFVGPCRVEVWDWQGGKRIAVGTDKHQAIFNHLDYLPEEKILIAAGGGDGGPILAFWNESLWEQKTEAPLTKAKPKAHIQYFAYDRQSQQLLAAGHNGMQVWSFTAVPTKSDEGKGKKG